MNKYITDNPKDNIEYIRNQVYIKDRQVYLRSMPKSDTDINLLDYVREEDDCYKQYNNEDMMEILFDEITNPLELAYWLAVGFAEVREFLRRYEDTGLSPEEIGLLQKENKRLKAKHEQLQGIKIISSLRKVVRRNEYRAEKDK